MFTVYRSNRAELLAELLAVQLRLQPPDPFQVVKVVVNTWPTSRWLGEQLALNLGAQPGAGIAANVRFPFPGSYLRQLVESLLDQPPAMADPWRARDLVWPLLEELPALIDRPEAGLLRRWLATRAGAQGQAAGQLDRPLWQLARAMADAFDDYTLYRPGMLAAWSAGERVDGAGRPLPPQQHWQPLLFERLRHRLPLPPLGERVQRAITRLQRLAQPEGKRPAGQATDLAIDNPVRLFGLSSMAPLQVDLLQALAGVVDVELYLLTPCRELWRRRDGSRASGPLGEDWLLEVPRLEARYGRLGAEFQQLLEGTGAHQLGAWQERDLFVGAASAARHGGREPSLLEQLQEQLVDPDALPALTLASGDHSLEFHACPGRLRQVQVVRDRILQLMAADPSLSPRDVLVMTPQVEAFAPLVAAVFGDGGATGVTLPWRLTDRSQQSEPGIAQGLLALLQLGGERLTATALEAVLACPPLLERHGIAAEEAGAISALLQRAGFRWGLDGRARGGEASHSFAWALDRLLLGLVLPEQPGLAPAATAPLAMAGSLEQQARWLQLLLTLRRTLAALERPRSAADWVALLRQLLPQLFGDGGSRSWELPLIHAALADWQAVAGGGEQRLPASVAAEVLGERLAADSGRFGHRSGALTISGLEPMRAIPYRLIVLMGLDAGVFPRQGERPGFHLLERERQLGDPSPADQDRYVLLESLLSARQHLLITWSSRDARTGETLMPCTPVRQWLALLEEHLGAESLAQLLRQPPANPLERRNFLPTAAAPAPSSDRRLAAARLLLEQQGTSPPRPLLDLQAALPPIADLAPQPTAGQTPEETWTDLLSWLQAPQRQWLEELGLRPREWQEPIEDLEGLDLDERSRSRLLREALTAPTCPDWRREQQGRGLMPPGSAADLEARQLDQRWRSLRCVLEELGPEGRQRRESHGLAAELVWRGEALVLVHPARPRSAQRLQLWLELLLACSSGAAPGRALLVGRKEGAFAVVEELGPLPAEQAAAELARLLQLRRRWRGHGWPVPPESGWAWFTAETDKPDSGLAALRQSWEGNVKVEGERCRAEMVLCFGAELPARALLTPTFAELAEQLYGPLYAHCRLSQSEPRPSMPQPSRAKPSRPKQSKPK